MDRLSLSILGIIIVASVVDMAANAVNVIPIFGTVSETVTESMLEIIQILGAIFLAINR